MELWKETSNKVYLEGDSGWSPSANYSKNGVVIGALTVDAYSDGRYGASLPYILDECTIAVTWTFTVPGTGSLTKTDSYEIITPLLTRRDIQKILPDATPDEVVEVESAVRRIIQSHCGQTFGKRVKDSVVVGSGETALALPERLMEITGLKTLSAVLNISSAIIIADGWYLKKKYHDIVSPIENDSVYWDAEVTHDYDYGYPTEAPHGLGHTPERYGHGKIISAPHVYSGSRWRDDYPFTISGTWGYAAVPIAVAEAAKLLINDYACSEQAYRDRYLDSINAADWKIQFNAQAFLNTGNVRADQLLNDYVMKRGWAVI